MKRGLVIASAALLLAGCGGDAVQAEPVVTVTEAAQPEPTSEPSVAYSIDAGPGSRVSLDQAHEYAASIGYPDDADAFHLVATAHCEGMALLGPASWYLALDEDPADPLTDEKRDRLDVAAMYACPELADEVLPNGVPGLE